MRECSGVVEQPRIAHCRITNEESAHLLLLLLSRRPDVVTGRNGANKQESACQRSRPSFFFTFFFMLGEDRFPLRPIPRAKGRIFFVCCCCSCPTEDSRRDKRRDSIALSEPMFVSIFLSTAVKEYFPLKKKTGKEKREHVPSLR